MDVLGERWYICQLCATFPHPPARDAQAEVVLMTPASVGEQPVHHLLRRFIVSGICKWVEVMARGDFFILSIAMEQNLTLSADVDALTDIPVSRGENPRGC